MEEKIDYSYGVGLLCLSLNLKNFKNSLRVISAEDHKGLHKNFSEPETNFSGKFFKLVDKTQFKALLQTQAAEVGCTTLEKTSLIRMEILL